MSHRQNWTPPATPGEHLTRIMPMDRLAPQPETLMGQAECTRFSPSLSDHIHQPSSPGVTCVRRGLGSRLVQPSRMSLYMDTDPVRLLLCHLHRWFHPNVPRWLPAGDLDSVFDKRRRKMSSQGGRAGLRAGRSGFPRNPEKMTLTSPWPRPLTWPHPLAREPGPGHFP